MNTFFCLGNNSPSFYKLATSPLGGLNPLNFISNRTFSRWFGISDDFYTSILQPFHGIQFSTIKMEHIPAVAMQALDEIVPLTGTREHTSWGVGNSQQVFSLATTKCQVHLERRVLAVEWDDDSQTNRVTDDSGSTCEFDRVVFACPSHAAANIMRDAGRYERNLLQAVGYHDDFDKEDWADWLEAPVHQDTVCMPEKHRKALMEHCAFLIDTDVHGAQDGTSNTQYTHCLGSWSPSAKAAGVAGADGVPMFMSQCLHKDTELDSGKVVKTFSAPRSHPDLSTSNIIATQLMRFIQGRKGRYFCSNYTAPGNGHDLSFLSGVSVATALGAEYPFPENAGAAQDHCDMRSFMGL